jgi:biopolymer transport protein ExbD
MLHFDDIPPRKARIEIIPMIDVMMFLLIFFVLISLNVIPAFGLKTALPGSSTAQRAVSTTKPVVITLLDDGRVALDGQPVAAADLPGRLRTVHQADLKRRVVVNADQTAKWQAVVEVMDLLRAQGIESVTFSARKS